MRILWGKTIQNGFPEPGPQRAKIKPNQVLLSPGWRVLTRFQTRLTLKRLWAFAPPVSAWNSLAQPFMTQNISLSFMTQCKSHSWDPPTQTLCPQKQHSVHTFLTRLHSLYHDCLLIILSPSLNWAASFSCPQHQRQWALSEGSAREWITQCIHGNCVSAHEPPLSPLISPRRSPFRSPLS